MSLQELKEQARQLPASDRLELLRAIIESLQMFDSPLQKEGKKGISNMKFLFLFIPI